MYGLRKLSHMCMQDVARQHCMQLHVTVHAASQGMPALLLRLDLSPILLILILVSVASCRCST